MKILFAGLKYDYGIILRGESLESKTFVPSLSKVSENFFLFWLEENGFPNDIKSLQNRLIDYVDQVKPDVVFFVLMNNEISPETLSYLSSKYITVNWFCDDTWRFNNFTKNILPHITYSITTDKYLLNEYRINNFEKVIYSQWATFDYIQNLKLDNINYKYDVTFIGGRNSTRSWLINELIKNDIKVNCFGSGWKNGRVSYDEIKDIFYHSKINLNLSNSISQEILFLKYIFKNIFFSFFNIFNKNRREYFNDIKSSLNDLRSYLLSKKTSEQIKARNFEIPGFGGFQLSQYSLGLEDFYDIGKEIALFNNSQELVKQCKFYLENETLRKQICFNGYMRTEQHTYDKRIKTIFDKIREWVK